MKALEWLERGKQLANLIDAFPNFWRAFNNLFYPIGNYQESHKIKLYIRNNVTEQQSSEILQGHTDSVIYLMSQPVIDMRGNGRDTASYIEAYNRATEEKIKLEEVFMVIYQVRCNLEHGQKSPTTERDIKLCESAALLIAELVEKTA